MSGLLRALRNLLHGLLALVVLFEEWGWEPLQRLLARLGRWRWVRRVEAGIARLPPVLALAVFALPGLALLPVKLAALWFVGRGHAVAGLVVIVLAKLLGTAVVARLYALTQPALMQIAWFARLHARWTAWKAHWLAVVRTSWAWRSARVLRRGIARRLARWRRG